MAIVGKYAISELKAIIGFIIFNFRSNWYIIWNIQIYWLLQIIWFTFLLFISVIEYIQIFHLLIYLFQYSLFTILTVYYQCNFSMENWLLGSFWVQHRDTRIILFVCFSLMTKVYASITICVSQVVDWNVLMIPSQPVLMGLHQWRTVTRAQLEILK